MHSSISKHEDRPCYARLQGGMLAWQGCASRQIYMHGTQHTQCICSHPAAHAHDPHCVRLYVDCVMHVDVIFTQAESVACNKTLASIAAKLMSLQAVNHALPASAYMHEFCLFQSYLVPVDPPLLLILLVHG